MTYKILATFHTEKEYVPNIERLVKMCDGRFRFDPTHLTSYSIIELEFKNIPDCKKFFILMSIIKQPYFK